MLNNLIQPAFRCETRAEGKTLLHTWFKANVLLLLCYVKKMPQTAAVTTETQRPIPKSHQAFSSLNVRLRRMQEEQHN